MYQWCNCTDMQSFFNGKSYWTTKFTRKKTFDIVAANKFKVDIKVLSEIRDAVAIPEQVKYYSSFGSFWLANVRVAEVSQGVFYKKFVFHYTLCDNIFDQNAAFENVYYNQFIYLHIYMFVFEVNVSPFIYHCRLVGPNARIEWVMNR